MKKYHVIIAPSSDNEDIVNQISFEVLKEALEHDESIYHHDKEVDLCGVSLHTFDTNDEAELFLKGYQAGVGYLGEGVAKLKEEVYHEIDNYSYNLGRQTQAKLNLAQLDKLVRDYADDKGYKYVTEQVKQNLHFVGTFMTHRVNIEANSCHDDFVKHIKQIQNS